MSKLDGTPMPSMGIPVSRRSWPGDKNFFQEPLRLKRIDQLFVKPDPSRISSFKEKYDRLHARIYDLTWEDPFTDMPNSSRRALASNMHFLLLKEMYDAVAARQVLPGNIELMYQHDTLENCHRALLIIVPTVDEKGGEKTDATVSMTGNWVAERTQALEGLRQAVDVAIYATN